MVEREDASDPKTLRNNDKSMNKMQKITVIPALGALMIAGGAIAGYASIASADQSQYQGGPGMGRMMQDGQPHVGGEITAISGSTITIEAMGRQNSGTYTINASGATITKEGQSGSLADLAVGDHIMATGSLSGTTLTATAINEGMGPRGEVGGRGHGRGPGVHGTVTSVSGSTITLTGDNGTTYTVNAGSADVQRMVSGSLSDITVGDTIGVHGEVSGTTVTADHIMEGVLPRLGNQQSN